MSLFLMTMQRNCSRQGHPQSLEPLESLDRNFFLNASYDGGDRQKAPAFRLAENRKIPRGISP